MPKRVPSAPYFGTSSVIGSIAFPSDLDILRPWMSNTSGVTNTVSNGSLPAKRSPSITIRETHRKMMSRLVIITWLGYQWSSSGVRAGQPRIENGHRPEENQVSSVSGSRRSSPPPRHRAARARCGALRLRRGRRSRRRRACTRPGAGGPTRPGARCSSRAASPGPPRRCARSARARSAARRARYAASAGCASDAIATNHCSESSGSITACERDDTGSLVRYGSSRTSAPAARRSATSRSRASNRSRPT